MPSGSAPSGARRRPTLAEVAARAGVSPTTASLVLNRRPARVPDETRERVLAAAADLQYVPNALVRSLQAGRTGTLGVYVELRASVWHNAFAGALGDGLRLGAAEGTSDVLLYRPPSPPAGGAAAPPAPASIGPATVMDGRADAAVLWLGATSGDAAPLRALARQRFPAVVLMHPAVPAQLGAVLVDERLGSRLLLEHLRALGHRRIAYFGSGGAPLAPHLRLRRDAFLAEAAAAGVPLSPDFQLAGTPAQTIEPLLAAVAGGAAGGPTAIVCAFEELAYRTIAAAERLGLRVPQDLSVAAWEIPRPLNAATAPSAALTGVHVPIWEMGRAAAELALNLARGRTRTERRLQFSPTLLVAGSTGSARRNMGC